MSKKIEKNETPVWTSTLSYAHWDGSRNAKGFSIGKDAIPQKIFQSAGNQDYTQYIRDQIRAKVTKNLGLIDGSLSGLTKTLAKLQAIPLLPQDKTVQKEGKDSQGITRTEEVNHQGNAVVNSILKAQIAQIEFLIKVRLGRRKEGTIA